MNMNRKDQYHFYLLFTLLFLPIMFWSSGCSQPAHEDMKTEGKRVAAKVYLTALDRTDNTYVASGDVRSRTTSILTAKIAGYVHQILVREGQKVSAGQTLAEIESAELGSQNQKALAGASEAEQARQETEYALQAAHSAVKAVEAQYRLASDTYKRFQALLAKESVSKQEFDEVEARYLATQAQLEQAKQSLEALKAKQSQVDAKIRQAQADVAGSKTFLSYLRIVAPFNGVITKRHIDPGTMAAPGVPLFTVEDASHLQLEVNVPESLRWKIQEGSPIMAEVDAAGLSQIAVKPLETPAAADAATRSFLFKLELPDSPQLRSGMFGRARFPIGSRQVLQIPETCLVRQGQLEGIFTLGENGKAEWRLVKTGATVNHHLEILSGLKAGEKVVDNPPADLVAGDLIEVRS